MTVINSKILSDTTEIRIRINYLGSAPVLAGYAYELKKKDANPPIEHHTGDNQNSQDDIYPLPGAPSENVGRMAIVTSKIAAIDKDSDYEVKIEVIQDGTVTDTLVTPTRHVSANDEAQLSYDGIVFI
jgi:hypothetical protein